MKISSIGSAINFFSRLADRENPSGGAGYERQEKGEHPNQDKPRDEATQDPRAQDPKRFENEVERALSAFAGEAEVQRSGLRAERSGSGFGLKVVLSDAHGSVLRRLSGEEFLSLRARSGSREHPAQPVKRGRLLDQKF